MPVIGLPNFSNKYIERWLSFIHKLSNVSLFNCNLFQFIWLHEERKVMTSRTFSHVGHICGGDSPSNCSIQGDVCLPRQQNSSFGATASIREPQLSARTTHVSFESPSKLKPARNVDLQSSRLQRVQFSDKVKGYRIPSVNQMSKQEVFET